MVRIRRIGTGLLVNGACFCLLATGMAALSEDMRRHILNLLSGDGISELAVVTVPAGHIFHQLAATFADYQIHGGMVAFGAVAAVLVGFMCRT